MGRSGRAVRALAIGLGAIPALTGAQGQAQTLTIEEARVAIASFYDALNEPAHKDVAALVTAATAPDWVSCGGNAVCAPRDKVIEGIAGLGKAVPDLKWTIVDLFVAGDRVTVRGEATGTPSGAFMGAPYGGKSFKLMSIDVHTIVNGKIVRSYHVEDWRGAARQLAVD